MQIALTNRQRPITLRAHGVLDYGYSLLLAMAPWLFQFSAEAAPRDTAVALGIMALMWSVATDYPLGMIRLLPFRAHLWLDAIAGMVLVLAPWMTPMSDKARLVLVGFGVVALIVNLLTRRPHPKIPS